MLQPLVLIDTFSVSKYRVALLLLVYTYVTVTDFDNAEFYLDGKTWHFDFSAESLIYTVSVIIITPSNFQAISASHKLPHICKFSSKIIVIINYYAGPKRSWIHTVTSSYIYLA